jgi:hypothetical protein
MFLRVPSFVVLVCAVALVAAGCGKASSQATYARQVTGLQTRAVAAVALIDPRKPNSFDAAKSKLEQVKDDADDLHPPQQFKDDQKTLLTALEHQIDVVDELKGAVADKDQAAMSKLSDRMSVARSDVARVVDEANGRTTSA